MFDLGPVDIWTRQLDAVSPVCAEAAIGELESLGYRAVWLPEARFRESFTHSSILLAATRSIAVATGIARIHSRSPQGASLAQRLLVERFPERFVLGLGVSHPQVVERMLNQVYGSPLATMRDYLDAMDATPDGASAAAAVSPRLLAALGPKMLRLSAERAAGAHTYLAPAEHTRWARELLGPEPYLAVAIKAVLTADPEQGKEIARWSVTPTSQAPAYRANLIRFGFTDEDLGDQLSDRLVDALVAIGDVEAIAARVREHLAAGASHVCVEVLTGDDTTIPRQAWRELADPLRVLA
jgi:probable F420-dependent oxidoreductase